MSLRNTDMMRDSCTDMMRLAKYHQVAAADWVYKSAIPVPVLI